MLGLQLGYFASYILLFVVGIISYRNKWLEQLSAGMAQYALPAGLKFIIVGLLATVCSFAASALLRSIPVTTRRVLLKQAWK